METRSRTRGALTPLQVSWSRKNSGCVSASEVFGPYDSVGVGTLEVMNDVVHPGFKALSSKGQIFSSPASKQKTTITASGDGVAYKSATPCTNGLIQSWDNSGTWTVRAVPGISPTPFDVIGGGDLSQMISYATTDAWAKLNGHEAALLEDLAQARQTIEMLRNPLANLRLLLNSLEKEKRGRSRTNRAKTGSQALANLWLQYQYGVKPIISTIDAILKELFDTKLSVRTTGRGSETLTASKVISGERLHSPMYTTWMTTHTDEITVRCGVLIEDRVTIAEALGLDASSLVRLPWDLLPYSFVADWFANVGSFLESLVPAFSSNPLAAWTVVKRTRKTVFLSTGSYPVDSSAIVTRQANDTMTATFETWSRSPHIDSPSLSLRPNMLQGFTPAHIVTSFALAVQQMHRIFK